MISAGTAAVSRAGRTRGRTYRSLGSEELVLRPLRCWWSSQEPGGWIRNAPKSQQRSQEPLPEQLPQAQEKLGEESLPPPSHFPVPCECLIEGQGSGQQGVQLRTGTRQGLELER